MKDSYSIFDLLNHKFSENLIKKFGIAYICFGIMVLLAIGGICCFLFFFMRDLQQSFTFATGVSTRNPNNPYYEQIKKYDLAIDECYQNFNSKDEKMNECKQYFLEKYREDLIGYKKFEKDRKEKAFEKIKENDLQRSNQ